MIECSVKQRGKFFIVVDPFNHCSYTLNNKLEAERLCETLNELHEKIQLLFKQIKTFRDDCATYNDFKGVSTLDRLIEILEGSMELFE